MLERVLAPVLVLGQDVGLARLEVEPRRLAKHLPVAGFAGECLEDGRGAVELRFFHVVVGLAQLSHCLSFCDLDSIARAGPRFLGMFSSGHMYSFAI